MHAHGEREGRREGKRERQRDRDRDRERERLKNQNFYFLVCSTPVVFGKKRKGIPRMSWLARITKTVNSRPNERPCLKYGGD